MLAPAQAPHHSARPMPTASALRIEPPPRSVRVIEPAQIVPAPNTPDQGILPAVRVPGSEGGGVRVIVFGATGKTGRHVLRGALDRGHEATAFGRSVDRLAPEPGLSVIRGDVFDSGAVAEAVEGHDGVIVCLGSTGLRDRTTLARRDGEHCRCRGPLRGRAPRRRLRRRRRGQLGPDSMEFEADVQDAAAEHPSRTTGLRRPSSSRARPTGPSSAQPSSPTSRQPVA